MTSVTYAFLRPFICITFLLADGGDCSVLMLSGFFPCMLGLSENAEDGDHVTLIKVTYLQMLPSRAADRKFGGEVMSILCQTTYHQEEPYEQDHSVYAPSQWEMALHCNAISHWLGAYTEWSLHEDKLSWKLFSELLEFLGKASILKLCNIELSVMSSFDVFITLTIKLTHYYTLLSNWWWAMDIRFSAHCHAGGNSYCCFEHDGPFLSDMWGPNGVPSTPSFSQL